MYLSFKVVQIASHTSGTIRDMVDTPTLYWDARDLSVTPTATLQESEEQGVGACADPPLALPPQPPSVRVSSIEPQQRNNKKESRRSSSERNDLIDSTLHEMSARSKVLFESLQKTLSQQSQKQPEEEENIFFFLAKKFKSFSPCTQEWLEDEAMKLFMEAKRREKYTSHESYTTGDNYQESYYQEGPSTSYPNF
ncbi:hypothetical protein PoB_006731800 [Plakobranchus ocellatus]|uniref:BESS domain-containing protein n=1 Tax=Plakobranchus ocellatus TaxID=259542 RepID=A0AAV4D992_9GAST|nr:hypothetical protein PoB_006731800 [Plakobranchus ocellatus]